MLEGSRKTVRVAVWAGFFMIAGCQTPLPEEDSKDTTQHSHVAGQVVTVNREFGYIVSRCALSPPIGTEASVYRDSEEVARVVFSNVSDYPYITADIVQGQPEKGDLVVY